MNHVEPGTGWKKLTKYCLCLPDCYATAPVALYYLNELLGRHIA